MGTRGQLATPSDSTVEGGPGLVLDNVLDSVPEGALGSQLVHVDQLDDHVGYLVLDVLEGGEGDVYSDLFLHVGLLSPCSLSNHLHVGLLRLGVVVLHGLGGGEGGVQRSAVHVKLLSFVPSMQPYRDLLRLWVCEHRGDLSWLVGLVQDGDEGSGVQGRRRQRSASAH
mgnify:CR=1 FL=1